MNKHLYLFRFGYCTPEQWAANEEHGWDDESSGAFFVSAENKQSALDWGNVVAEAFTRRLFEVAGWTRAPSWVEAQFAAWVDDTPDDAFASELRRSVPPVSVGEMPDLETWRPY